MRTLITLVKNYKKLREVETYCMFIGYPRSGHSLIGSLLNAHPEIVISHELDALKHVDRNISKSMLYASILDRDNAFARRGRQWTGYNYAVPGQWHGRFQKIRVIGDKKGGRSTMELKRDDQLFDRLQNLIKGRIRIVHIVRNPFDNIATMFNIKKKKNNDFLLENILKLHFIRVAFIEDLITAHGDKILTMKYEDLIAQPQSHLNQLGEFLGVTCSDDYLNACASIVNSTPSRSRSKIQWPENLIDQVNEHIEKISFLKGYSFND